MGEDDILGWDAERRRGLARLFAFGLGLALLGNAFHIFQFPLTIDGEVAAFTWRPEIYLQNERWAAYGLNLLLLPRPVIPIVPDLLASAALAAAYAVTSLDWDPRPGFAHCAAAPVAVLFPSFAEVVLFPDLSYALFIGLALAAAGAVLVQRRTPAGLGGGLAAFTVAVGVYQPIALYPAAALAVKAALELRTRPPGVVALAFAPGFATLALAALASHAIGHAIVVRSGMSSAYIDASVDLAPLFDRTAEVLSLTLSNAAAMLAGTYAPIYLEPSPAIAVLLAAALVGLALAGRRARGLAARVLPPLVLVADLLAMAAVPMIDGGVLPNRTLLGLPIAAAGLVFAGARGAGRPMRIALGAAAALCALQFASIDSRVFYAAYVTWLNDRALGREVLARVAALPDLPVRRPLALEIVGHHEWAPSPMTPAVVDSMVGSSFFAWDGGNVGRIVRFFRSLGVGPDEFSPATREEHGRVAAAAAAMPSWPAAGAVRVIGGTVVVKFGPYGEYQL